MSEIARDSGIIVDHDESSETSSLSAACTDCRQMSYVQKLRKRFELLSREQDREFHSGCNWWLDDEDEQHVVKVERQHSDTTLVSENQDENESGGKNAEEEEEKEEIEEEKRRRSAELQKQISVGSQRSQRSIRSQRSADESDERPVSNVPKITLDRVHDDEDEVFGSGNDDIEEELEEQFLRHSKGSKQLERLSRPTSITSQTSNISTTSKLSNIIRELQENEENYVRSLNSGIKNYVTVMNSRELPKSLRGQRHRVFGNIESIYKFHSKEFLPRLLQCGEDVEQIAELFTSYVTKDYFYGYIIYAINRKRSELSCNYHVHYWKQIQNACGDRLGINSFLLQPIQRLPRYQLLLNEIIKDLSKDLENTKQAIAACCVAEKNIQRLLDTVNESMSINDVRNCFDIDILCQGKFKKMDEFDIYDWEIRRRFRGKVFLFERCVVYTEVLDREYLEYRGHYESEKLGIIYKEGKSKFKLFAKRRGHKEVEFYSDLNTVVEWKSAITGMLMDFVAAEKKRNAMSSVRRSSTTKHRSIPDSVRSSVMSNTSNQSNFSIGSSFRSSTSSRGSTRSTEPRTSNWYV